jgi:hypothetical protein
MNDCNDLNAIDMNNGSFINKIFLKVLFISLAFHKYCDTFLERGERAVYSILDTSYFDMLDKMDTLWLGSVFEDSAFEDACDTCAAKHRPSRPSKILPVIKPTPIETKTPIVMPLAVKPPAPENWLNIQPPAMPVSLPKSVPIPIPDSNKRTPPDADHADREGKYFIKLDAVRSSMVQPFLIWSVMSSYGA